MRNLLLALPLLFLMSCGDDDSGAQDAGLDAAVDPDSAVNPDSAVADAAVDAATHPDAGPPTTCGGFGGGTCAETQYCDYDVDNCGAWDNTGTCVDRPVGCPDIACGTATCEVCACDGNVYADACTAYTAGVDVTNLGGCTAPVGFFACGQTFCSLSAEYCRRDVSDIGGYPDGYACHPLPTCVVDPMDCSCFENETCGFMCDGTVEAGFTLTCPGG